MSDPADLKMQRFGRLLVLQRQLEMQNAPIRWFCSCICGNNITVKEDDLMNDIVKSCGCFEKRFPDPILV